MLKKEQIDDVFDKIIEVYEEKHFKTGFHDLDFIRIPKKEGTLITIESRPIMGKTSLILSIIWKLMKENKKVLLFSTEETSENLIKRLASINGEIKYQKLIDFRLQADDWKKLSDTIGEMYNWDLRISDNMFNIKQIEREIYKHKPEAVFIDSLQGFDEEKNIDRTEQFERIMTRLKIIAKKMNIPIFITIHLTQNELDKREKDRPTDVLGRKASILLNKLGTIDKNADIVLYLHRDYYYPDSRKPTITVEKNFGRTNAEVYLQFDPAFGKFYTMLERPDLLENRKLSLKDKIFMALHDMLYDIEHRLDADKNS